MGPGEALALALASLAVLKAVYDLYAGRKRDDQALTIAKRQAPEVQKQLELGNFKAAMEGVNIAQTIMAQEMERLRQREIALEAESQGWEHRANEFRARAEAAEARQRAADLRAERAEMRVDALEDKLKDVLGRCERLEAEVMRLGGRPG